MTLLHPCPCDMQSKILDEVRNMIGHTVHPDEPLLTAGEVV